MTPTEIRKRIEYLTGFYPGSLNYWIVEECIKKWNDDENKNILNEE